MKRQEIEDNITNYWEKNKVFERSVEERPKNNEYVFYDGPPFATGLPHHGHIMSLITKDLFPRYHTMKGYRVERRWGWDCHGLPIENIVEKDLKIKEKKQIEEMGVDKFNEVARTKVLGYVDEWKKTVGRIGKWIEFDDSYKTMDQTYMESVWSIFKKLYDKGFIYEGKKVLMYCPRCETPLANSEIQMDNSYKDVVEKTATVGFKIKGSEDEYLLAWTTTPWTLIGNVAIAVNPKLTYAKVDVFGKKFILAKDLLDATFKDYKIIEEFKGKKLIDVEYEPLYEMDTEGKKGFYVIDGGEEVTSEDGTGLVHMAIYGEFDYLQIRKHDLPIIQHIGANGLLEKGPEQWKGKWFKKLDGDVLEDLYNRGILVEAKEHNHSYPFCYRCETPLIYNAVDSWFVDIGKIKPKLIKKAKEINWHPKNVETRFNHIVETAPDWSISRNRFWATAIPVWKCECGEEKIIGSVKELQENATTKVEANVDLHKHIVDKIKLKCKCGKEMERIPEVLDCWFESGSMPYASKHFPFENEKWLKEHFPADFISEYIGQVRAWFYYMHVLGVLLMDKPPFKHCVVNGNILAEDGNKMSKSKGNFTDPNKLLDEYGADAFRFYLMSTPVMKAQDMNFSDEGLREVSRKLLNILTNVNRFYELFASENKVLDDDSSKDVMDKWIISKTHKLIKDSTTNLDDYNTVKVCADVLCFVDDLSTWFVRRSRDRFKSEGAEKENAFHTLAFALDNLSKVMAPITPFVAEEIYQTLRGENFEKNTSIHLEEWPKSNKKLINLDLEEKMVGVREIVSKGLDERIKVKLAVKQPLAKVIITTPIELTKELEQPIMSELNVKAVEIKKGKELLVELDTKLTPELEQEGAAREIMRKINDLRKKIGLTIQDKIGVSVETDSELINKTIEAFGTIIANSVQADDLKLEKNEGTEFVIKEQKVKIEIKKK
ncbi:MAG: isoleucine--tRNA ligase [Candidatus Diapherotrites archaeon]|jgi:isoleucyl-tRNA synthetase|uniref:Isoleucine--tRNA ligase n=1 Tax=Candidatus Iainarchaeum sp. TaxID=3101447 RepID=A0A8T5GFM9_9ARCH|nr:isoleucine--tRNA ligase [Candidatus Diapherotrites archaeon]MBT7241147.1 isoleucine--tRNA ligase [Candidatus Diapherotrites archaeon]